MAMPLTKHSLYPQYNYTCSEAMMPMCVQSLLPPLTSWNGCGNVGNVAKRSKVAAEYRKAGIDVSSVCGDLVLYRASAGFWLISLF